MPDLGDRPEAAFGSVSDTTELINAAAGYFELVIHLLYQYRQVSLDGLEEALV
jgi:hypothetical protein